MANFQNEISFYQLKANLDVKILLFKPTCHFDSEIRKKLVRGLYWNKHSILNSGPCFP